MMSEADLLVLASIVERTIKTRGKSRGETKALISCEETYTKHINKLRSAGLIEYKVNTIHGDGFTATPKALEFLAGK